MKPLKELTWDETTSWLDEAMKWFFDFYEAHKSSAIEASTDLQNQLKSKRKECIEIHYRRMDLVMTGQYKGPTQ